MLDVTSVVGGKVERSPDLSVSPCPRVTASIRGLLSPHLSFAASVFLLALFVSSIGAAAVQAPPPKQATSLSAEVAKKYVGRYELESGIIPVSTLDITFENNELWIKPSVLKKRRMIYKPAALKSANVFLDEISGAPYKFNRDEEGRIVSLAFQYEEAEYIAQRVELPPPSLKGNTTFRLKGYEGANVIVLSGSFNNWHQSQYVFGREGDEWICRIDLEPGKHAYKFIVDGNWILDPDNPNTEDDDYGVKNSVMSVAKAP
ncbi:MAG: hypothetical protein JWM21_4326 [Acidobacteria bacterium]|nr:hypothetical protein [Acidobacteriota bacterium]